MQQQPQPEPQQKPQRAQQYRAVLEYDAGRTAMVLLSTGSQGLQLDFEVRFYDVINHGVLSVEPPFMMSLIFLAFASFASSHRPPTVPG